MRTGLVFHGGKLRLRTATVRDHGALIALWLRNGIAVRDGDDRRGVGLMLRRNKGLSIVATMDGAIVGSVLVTWDGRRGWLHHMAVERACRRAGVASLLVAEAERRLRAMGATRVKAEVYSRNRASRALFRSMGYEQYERLLTFGKRL